MKPEIRVEMQGVEDGTVDFLPFKVHYDGLANIGQYFDREGEVTSFRGRFGLNAGIFIFRVGNVCRSLCLFLRVLRGVCMGIRGVSGGRRWSFGR